MKTVFYTLILLLHQNTFGQTNYGVIDFETVLNSQSHKIHTKLQNNINLLHLEDSLAMLTSEFYSFIEGGYSCTILDSNKTLEYQDSIMNTQMRIEMLYKYGQKMKSNLKLKMELDLKEEITEKIETFKHFRNIKMIMDKQSILYGAKGIDFTEDFIKHLK